MDIKGLYQSTAEEIAITKHNTDFYDLPSTTQHDVYNQAIQDVIEQQVAMAEARHSMLYDL